MRARIRGVRRSSARWMTLAAGVAAALTAVFWPAAGGATPVTFTNSKFVSFTLEGCRNDGTPTITLPNGDGKFICPDAAYTTGNLGKGWNELDLVPHRLTTQAGTQSDATTDYNVVVAADNVTGGKTGYDLIDGFEVNAAKSNASCTVSAGPPSYSGTASAPFGGGTDTVIYRTLTIHQNKGTTCVIDYYQRLALGSSGYPGSSLQSYMFEDSGLSQGKKTISIPVTNAIQPQEINKTMLAQRDSEHTWDVTKSPTPASLDFGNVCDNSFSNTQGVDITVTWTKGAATPFGQTTITTHVYATNPAARTITVSVSDSIYAGTDQSTLIDTALVGSADVPANTTMEIGSGHTVLTSDTSLHFNDVATATYTDKLTGVTVPGNTQATASEDVKTGSELDQSATITDAESITGSGLSFSVASPSVGSFTNSYTAGTYVPNNTLSEVDWSSGSQSDSSSVTFNKTVKLDPAQSTSGTLSDTASLVGSDGATASSGELDVDISSSKLVKLTITKDIPNILQGTETASFTFDVYDSSNTKVATKTISFAAGQTEKSVDVTDLAPDTYTVKEETASGWQAQTDQNVDLTSRCSDGATFTNHLNPANAKAVKVTDPTGYRQGWTMTLNGPGAGANGESRTTDANGNASFTTDLQEGSYTITETSQTGWTQQSAVGCSFTVSYPADAGKTFTCTITNKSRGTVRVVKQINNAPISGSQDFQFELRLGDQHTTSTASLQTLHANSTNGGTIDFTYQLVPGQTYAICELLAASYNPTIVGYGPYNPTDAPNYWCWNFQITVAQAANAPSITFTVENDHPMSKALTIGYWKNWSGCKKSNGGQTDQLGKYLGGITLGTYTFTNSQSDECNAVQTLSKNTFTGSNKSSDPLFSMAAQLLAADLNVNAQAGVCSAAVTAINNAQALLVKYHWNGNTYTPKLTSTDASLANSLAATLDKYNNNQLC
jgi:hypothetical protein